jgi:hypothetical protein
MSDKKCWQAACDTRLPPHLGRPWFGPERDTYAAAKGDADKHNKNPGHDAGALETPCSK